MTNFNTDDWEKQQIQNAKAELTEIEAMIILASNNTLGCEINIAGLKIGLCNNKKILPILRYQKTEIEKFLQKKKNTWE
jgi:hypothetical protein